MQMKKNRLMLYCLGLFCAATLMGGCKLIFEPAPNAVNRLLRALAARDLRVMEELVEDESLRSDLRALSVHFTSDFFRGHTEYWDIDPDAEVDEESKLSYVYVTLYVPDPNRSLPPRPIEIVFEMERSYLRWTIYEVEGIDVLNNAISRSRGLR